MKSNADKYTEMKPVANRLYKQLRELAKRVEVHKDEFFTTTREGLEGTESAQLINELTTNPSSFSSVKKQFVLLVDKRGSVYTVLENFFSKHRDIRKDFELIGVDNQKIDLIALNHKGDGTYKVTWLIEFCITDMQPKVFKGQLEKELWGDVRDNYLMTMQRLGAENIAVIGAQPYDAKTYQTLNSKMQQCKGIYVYLPTTPLKAMEKAISLIYAPSPVNTLYPVLKKNKLGKTFALSISALLVGISEGLGVALAEVWHRDIGEAEISFVVDDYLNKDKPIKKRKHYGELANKIYQQYLRTWGKEPEEPEAIAVEEVLEEVAFVDIMEELDKI